MPPEFEHLSLDEILYQYADKLSENTGIQVTYTSGSCNPIPNETAYELYRIVQEITMNIVKHANAHCISVSLYAEHEKQYTLKITDDGTVTTPHKDKQQRNRTSDCKRPCQSNRRYYPKRIV